MSPPADSSSGIQAKLGTFDTAMVVVSLVVGIGIFRTPAIVAREAGTRGLFYGAWALGGLVALAGALVFAEIGSRHPRAGGYYRVVADEYAPSLAFALNWAQTIMQGAGAAGVAFIGAEFLAGLLAAPERRAGAVAPLAFLLMLVLLALNALGVKVGARTQNVLSLSKIVLIAALAAAAFFFAPAAPAAAAVPAAARSPWLALASALVPVFYACGGYHMTMNLGADVKDARRRFPLAVTGGMLAVVALYLLVNAAYETRLSLAGVAASPLVAAALAKASLGRAAEAFVSVAIFLSAAGFVNATILQMPRAYLAMAEDGVLPAAFRRVSPRTQVSPAGLLAFGATMLLPALVLGSFEKLLNYVIFTDALTLVVVSSTIFGLRRRNAGGDAAFRVPLFPLLPALYVLALSLVAARVAATEPRLALAGAALLATGFPLFALGRRLATSA